MGHLQDSVAFGQAKKRHFYICFAHFEFQIIYYFGVPKFEKNERCHITPPNTRTFHFLQNMGDILPHHYPKVPSLSQNLGTFPI